MYYAETLNITAKTTCEKSGRIRKAGIS